MVNQPKISQWIPVGQPETPFGSTPPWEPGIMRLQQSAVHRSGPCGRIIFFIWHENFSLAMFHHVSTSKCVLLPNLKKHVKAI